MTWIRFSRLNRAEAIGNGLWSIPLTILAHVRLFSVVARACRGSFPLAIQSINARPKEKMLHLFSDLRSASLLLSIHVRLYAPSSHMGLRSEKVVSETSYWHITRENRPFTSLDFSSTVATSSNIADSATVNTSIR